MCREFLVDDAGTVHRFDFGSSGLKPQMSFAIFPLAMHALEKRTSWADVDYMRDAFGPHKPSGRPLNLYQTRSTCHAFH